MTRLLLVQWLFHTLSFSLFMACISLFANLKLGMDAQQVGLMLTIAALLQGSLFSLTATTWRGWSAIIFLAGLLGIDTALYEAASVEGASRMQRIRWISLPGILPVVVVITLLRLGNILDAGFQQIFVLYSLPVYSVSDILDTWIYRSGVLDFQLSLASAVGLFKGVIGLLLIVTANRLAKRAAGSGLY